MKYIRQIRDEQLLSSDVDYLDTVYHLRTYMNACADLYKILFIHFVSIYWMT